MASNYAEFVVLVRSAVGVTEAVGSDAVAVASATDVDTGTDTITATAHGQENGQMLLYTEGAAAIGNLTTGNYYYVVNKATDTFQVSATEGGGAIDLTGTGTGTQTFTPAATVKVRQDGAAADVAESPLKTNADGEIVAGSIAALSAGTLVHFRVENYRGLAATVSQTTT